MTLKITIIFLIRNKNHHFWERTFLHYNFVLEFAFYDIISLLLIINNLLSIIIIIIIGKCTIK
jgi:hypothetical protein